LAVPENEFCVKSKDPLYDAGEYYFKKDIEGHTILFAVEFVKENGV
jgi:hypothetical protein